jgi:AmmeMemoRadiSam system protein A
LALQNLTESDRRVLMDLVRGEIRHALRGSVTSPQIPHPTPGLMQPAGCFVSLHEQGSHRLRGCIGKLDATQALLVVAREMATAVLQDPRFVHDRVTFEELGRLQVEISVLAPLRAAADPLDFDLLNDGILLNFEGRSGCFLPQVAQETGWTKEQLLHRLCTEKMGMPGNTWRDPRAQLQVFSTVTIGPQKL